MGKDILLPLRYLHGRLHEKIQRHRQAKAFRRYLKQSGAMTVLIPGTPSHTNLGDSAIVIAQEAFLRECGFSSDQIKEVTFDEYARYGRVLRKSLTAPVLIAQLGGGNMGNQWIHEEYFHRQVTRDFFQTPMVIFPQTIYYTPDENGEQEQLASIPVYGGHEKLTMVAREHRSYDIMKELYPETALLLTPDIVLSADMDTFGAKPQPRQGVLLCMRSDAERNMSDSDREAVAKAVEKRGLCVLHTDMHSDKQVTKENRAQMVRQKMEQIAGARLLITDRLHGMIFAALTGTPCIVFGNYNHKVCGTYEWIRYLPYIRFAASPEDVAKHLPELLGMEDCRYDKTPLIPYFEKLAKVVKKYAHDQRDRAGL